jgi:hypothetical protein
MGTVQTPGHAPTGPWARPGSERRWPYCNQLPGPATAQPGIYGPGGGRTGAVLISPFIKGRTVSSVPYNHYSTLSTVEDLFGLPKLGQAKTVSATFGNDVFTGSG